MHIQSVRRRIIIAIAITSLVACFVYWEHDTHHLGRESTLDSLPVRPLTTQSECERFSPADDMLVVVKTGATEIHKKLPIHFFTTLKCIPHFVIYSDMDERIKGVQIHDILKSISSETRSSHEDFILYNQLQDLEAQHLNLSDLVSSDSNHHRAWNLDKWKFLPMMDKAYQNRPDAKWFVFLETDTAIIWSNLFSWLLKFDPREPWYLGGQTWIGDVVFAHGGTGWIMSNPAVQRIADEWRNKQMELEALTAGEWAGDRVLAMVLKSVGVELTKSWPILQGESPFTLDYTSNHWCQPVVTYHHVSDRWVKAISEFEEEWVMRHTDRTPIRHGDAFESFVQPNIVSERNQWDNICRDEEAKNPITISECRQVCEAKPSCLQWSHVSGKCKTGTVIRLGSSQDVPGGASDMVSGWMTDRIEKFKKAQPNPCPQDNWIVP